MNPTSGYASTLGNPAFQQGQAYDNAIKPNATLTSILGDSHAMLARAQDALKLAMLIGDGLCGATPRPVSGSGQKEQASGGIAQLDHVRTRVDETITSIYGELHRIAHALDPSVGQVPTG